MPGPDMSGVGGFKMPEQPGKPEGPSKPTGDSDAFKLQSNKSGGNEPPMNDIEMQFIAAFGPEKGKKAYNRFIQSFMITAVNQMHAASQAAIQREKQANRGQ